MNSRTLRGNAGVIGDRDNRIILQQQQHYDATSMSLSGHSAFPASPSGSAAAAFESRSYPQHVQMPLSVSSSSPLSSSSSSPALPPHPSDYDNVQLRLSLNAANPLPDSTWKYTSFLAMSLMLWVAYLLAPRGFRKQYCGAGRRRYACRTDKDMPAGGYWLPASKVAPESVISGAGIRDINAQNVDGKMDHRGRELPSSVMSGTTSEGWSRDWDDRGSSSANVPSSLGRTTRSGDSPSYQTPDNQSSHNRTNKTPPSPEHPAIHRIPPNKILAETMTRLQGRGIRLMAHGVQCEPKRVWIKLDQESDSVTWQTEFPRRVPNQSGEVSIVLMRGSLHRISLKQVLYIDVGKKTNALMRHENQRVPEQTCLSLLTQNGSLDLQANSKLERDALVSCFSMILDQVHSEDWRALYEASPEPSLASSARLTSSDAGGTTMSGRPYGSDMASV
eukprot:CAMPEP_0119554512 /NCGR_PEP_ID=MMETSP1352-20130426/6990_1 /TAXON_ID=265584 /ORGANISM="Stauroneis constricta, Strain CCMP1120" /LENGTH=446 /DNA_ID=CAMNT_0007601119 /DNA_START=124 /DNA_END=1464 /DNA_ORIENTATION=+